MLLIEVKHLGKVMNFQIPMDIPEKVGTDHLINCPNCKANFEEFMIKEVCNDIERWLGAKYS